MSEINLPAIYVDGDACPVKDEVLKVAARHKLEVFMVSNSWLRKAAAPNVHAIVVPEGPDAADDWIAEHIGGRDIAVTADIPLAARCLEAGAQVLGSTGKPFTNDSIGMALAMRELNTELRETGEIKGYVAAFTKKDRSRFLEALEQAVQKVQRI
ncbi:MAG: YaiI/YqxD family protein [Proteobacteria bacterium]|nr:YaiI/YqxD family protein [Pseudomonadota bacterium]